MATQKVGMVVMCLAVITAAFSAAGCGNTIASNEETWQVSVEEATSVLNQAVAYAQARNLEKLGVLADDKSMTRGNWERAGGWEAVPVEPPEIVDTYLLPTKHLENGYQAIGGRVLVLEGVDGMGRHYRTEFLVFRTDGPSSKLAVINVIYWSGSGIGQWSEGGSATTQLRPRDSASRLSQSSCRQEDKEVRIPKLPGVGRWTKDERS
ncbi:MAG: hypothetical protein IBX68_07205 [Dehalococcoidia bacterium]|nr:hypothetical protein [Dehalococcoidia bacterium]